MGFKELCRECIEFLCKQKDALEEKEAWSEEDSDMYESLEAYCRAIHSALETIDFYEQMKAIVELRFSPEVVKDMEHSWLQLKMAETNERLGFTQEDFDKWAEERRKNQKPDTESN